MLFNLSNNPRRQGSREGVLRAKVAAERSRTTKRRCCLSAGELQRRFERDTINGALHLPPSGFDGATLSYSIAQRAFLVTFFATEKSNCPPWHKRQMTE
jgi:hypothetical protein